MQVSSLLLVCRANLCRSPMAEVVYRTCAPAMGLQRVASAGVWAAPRGEPMDGRARAALERREYEPNAKWRSRPVVPEDLAKFDLILAMDATVLEALQKLWPGTPPRRLRLLLDQMPGHEGQDVPDPYYSTAAAFDRSLDLIERSVPHFKG